MAKTKTKKSTKKSTKKNITKINIKFKKFNHNMADKEKAGWLLALEQIMVMETGVARLGAITEKNQDNKGILKKSRITGEPVPKNLQTIYTLSWSLVGIGHNYQNLVNNILVKAGLEPNFESGASYAIPYQNSKLVFQHKKIELERFYFRVYPEACAQFDDPIYKHYDANFVEIPDDEYSKIKDEYVKASGDSLVKVNNYKMQSIYVVEYGEHFDKIQNSDFTDLLNKLKEEKKSNKKSA